MRHEDGTQEGTYGWVDPNGVLRYSWHFHSACIVVIVMVMSVKLLAFLFGNISFHRLFDYVADNLGYRIVQVFTFGFVQFSLGTILYHIMDTLPLTIAIYMVV